MATNASGRVKPHDADRTDPSDRPSDCECSTRINGLPCWPCFAAGFEATSTGEAAQAAAAEIAELLADPEDEPVYDREHLRAFVETVQGGDGA